MIQIPFAFMAGQATPGGWDPTLGGTVTPDYWWDLQDSSTMTLSGANVLGISSKGSQTDGDLTSTINNGTLPIFGTDGLGKQSVRFQAGQRLGSPLTLIPHQQNCTVFVAFTPTDEVLPNSYQVVFGHEGYTYSGNFGAIGRTISTKTGSNTQQYIYNNVTEGYGVAAAIDPVSITVETRPRPESTTALWTRSGVEGITTGNFYDQMHTQIATRNYFNPGTPNEVRVSNATNTDLMWNVGTTIFTPSTAPDEGTAIGNAGRPSVRDAYRGNVYQVVVYFQELTQPQITQLYNGWIADF
jgi:hypothetical protein